MNKITITATQTIIVTPDLNVRDLSDPNSMNPNKLRAVMDWNEEPVKIMIGVGEYPEYIAEWKTVKALEEAKVLTVVRQPKIEKKVENKVVKPQPKLGEE